MRNKRRTDAEWMDLIQTCRSSGMTDRAWCEQNDISINTFYNTIARLRKKSCEIPRSQGKQEADIPEIVPLSVIDCADLSQHYEPKSWNAPSDKTPSMALTLTVNGCTISINNHASREVIYNTLSALRQL